MNKGVYMNKKSDNSCGCNTSCKCGKTKYASSCDCNIIHEEAVNKARQSVLDEDSLICVADFYKAMADSTRIKILNLLFKHELCVCDISVILNMTKSAISHQLQNLKDMNLIKSRKQGKEVWYSLADRHVEEVFKISLEHVLEEK